MIYGPDNFEERPAEFRHPVRGRHRHYVFTYSFEDFDMLIWQETTGRLSMLVDGEKNAAKLADLLIKSGECMRDTLAKKADGGQCDKAGS